ncbi:MAG: transglycosylase SLT domain-containing protein [Pseudomonadota bacterium]
MNHRILSLLALAAIGLRAAQAAVSPSPSPSPAAAAKPDLTCNDPFPCPPELRDRILFWADVFGKWGANQRILHGNQTPERVYSVLETSIPCGKRRHSRRVRSENNVIETERKKLKAQLFDLADRLDRAEKTVPEWSSEDQKILALFPAPNGLTLRDAAENIRCQEGNRDRFKEGVKSYARYKDMVVAELEKAKLPTDLQYLPFVESSYNPRALSRLNAAGMWQFMPRAARLFGLKVKNTLDERFDPEKSTIAATKYFKMSYGDLGPVAARLDPELERTSRENPATMLNRLGPFVVTSYNYGLAGVRRAMTEEGTDFVRVLFNYSGRRFRTAVQNFYASFLAARHVATKMTAALPTTPSQDLARFELPKKISAKKLSEQLNVPIDQLQTLNPALTRAVWRGRLPIPEGYTLHLPKREGGWDPLLASLLQMPMEVTATEESYRVKAGDTPCGIARDYSVSCQTLIAANDLDASATIRAGQILFIPAPKQTPTSASAPTEAPKVALASTPLPTQPPKPAPTASPLPTAAPAKTPIPTPSPSATQVAETKVAAAETSRAFGAGQDLAVHESKKETAKLYEIVVEPDETIGHYAEWLAFDNTRSIRALNRLQSGESVQLGRKIRLPIGTEEMRTTFERRRIEYHRTLEDEFHQRYEVIGTEPYTIKAGDSEWTISSNEEVPLWLLKRFNPELLKKPLRIGDILTLPMIQEKVAPNGSPK